MSTRRMNLIGTVDTNQDTSDLVNETICSKCGGECCKYIGCAYLPEDFDDLTYEGLMLEIEKGYISIDIDTNETFNLYLRARNKHANVYDLKAPGECKALTEKGCMYDFKHRPSEGRLLKPLADSQCISGISMGDIGKAWSAYAPILEKLKEHYICKLEARDLRLSNGTLLTVYLDENFKWTREGIRHLRFSKNLQVAGFNLGYNFSKILETVYNCKDFNTNYDLILISFKDEIYRVLEKLEKEKLSTTDIYFKDIVAWLIYKA